MPMEPMKPEDYDYILGFSPVFVCTLILIVISLATLSFGSFSAFFYFKCFGKKLPDAPTMSYVTLKNARDDDD